MNRNLSYLLDINQFSQDLLQFVENMDEATFLTDKKTQNAVLYNITIIGEAVKKLTPDFREQYPQIPWKQIAGMRDKLVHDYRQINLKQVWLVTQIDIPELLKNLINVAKLIQNRIPKDAGENSPMMRLSPGIKPALIYFG